MISLCTVIVKGMEPYLDILADSVVKKCRNVKEVVAIKIDEKEVKLINKWNIRDVNFKIVGAPLSEHRSKANKEWEMMICGHATGLHYALEYASNEYIWFCDPDVFFLSSADDIFLDCIKNYNLNAVGVSHFNTLEQSYGYFPCIISYLTKKSNLPSPEWLNGDFHAWSGMRLSHRCRKIFPTPGKYLMPGPLPSYQYSFPNPDGIFDAGCNLWLWNEHKKGRWMSFHLEKDRNAFRNNGGVSNIVYPLNYNMKNYKTNFGLDVKMPDQDILYHRTRSSKENAGDYCNLYHSLKNPIKLL